MKNRFLILVGTTVLATLSGCATAPVERGPVAESTPAEAVSEAKPLPVSPVGEARVLVGEAKAAGYSVAEAELFLRRAEQAEAAEEEEQVAAEVEQVKQAIAARKEIEAARPLVTAAVRQAGELASDATKVLDAAEAALKAGDPARARELAAQARRQADTAVENKKLEQERIAREQSNRYRVVRGDSLWRIAGRAQIYGNPSHWPLLYRANHGRIKDPDLILPGQSLRIDRDSTPAEQAAAERHARGRGAWQVGPVEPGDRAFVGK